MPAELLPQIIAVRRVASSIATPNDTCNYPRVDLLAEDETDNNEYHYIFKIILVGDSGVGKTNLLSRFTHNVFNAEVRSTIGVDMMTRHVRIHSQSGKVTTRLQIWDSAGQERFRAMSSVFYRNSSAAMLVYDITDRKSFSNVPNWLKQIRTYSSDAVILLVGNKCDLGHIRTVPKQSGADFAREHDLLFFETSAFSCANVLPAFIEMVKTTFLQFEDQQQLEINKEKDSLFDETEGVDLPNSDGSSDDISTDRALNPMRAAARAVVQPLLKLGRKRTIVIDDHETSGARRRRGRKRSKCCRKG